MFCYIFFLYLDGYCLFIGIRGKYFRVVEFVDIVKLIFMFYICFLFK